MICNYTEKLSRIVGIGVLFALAIAAESALATEVEAGARVTDDSIATLEDHADAVSAGAEDASEALVDSVDEASSEAGEDLDNALAESLSGDVSASVDATIRGDVRSAVQQEVIEDLVRSLPLPGAD